MSVHSAFVGKTVKICIDNGADKPKGFVQAAAVSETADGLVIHASRGGVMQDIELKDDRIFSIEEVA